jgi:hypothetical protein
MRITKNKIAIFTLIFSILTLTLPIERAQAADSITSFGVVASSRGGLIVTVAYNYDSKNGDHVFMGAEALTLTGAGIGTGFRPWPIRAGSGRAYIDLSFSGAGTPSSQLIRVFMYRGGEAIFASQTFGYTRTWTQQADDIFPGFFRTISQTARDLNFDVLYSLLASHSAPVRLGAYSLRNGVISSEHGFGPSARLTSGSFRTATSRLSFVGAGTDVSDGLLVFLYEEAGPIFIHTVVPRMKYWADSTTDSDGDGVSNANELALGTSTSSRDSDDDGLEDGWELEGYRASDAERYTQANLPFRGANPRHRDVFVWVDYLTGLNHDHKMHLDSIYKAKEIFGSMPIANPDGRNGLALRVIHGTAIDFDGGIAGVCGQRAYLSYLPAWAARIYHWTIAGHGTGGQAEVTSNRFVFGTGNGNPNVGSMSVRDKFLSYAVFVHELAHNLGLLHEGRSGANQSNCKANYGSLMNYAYDYAFDCTGYDLATTEIQFSGGGRPALSENALRETGNTGLGDVRGFDSDFLGCNLFRVSGGNIDWTRNTVYQAGTVSVDLDGVAPSCCRRNAMDVCIGGDGLRADQRDSNDFQTVRDNMDESIETPGRAACSGDLPQGEVYVSDMPEIQPVCGIPAYDRLEDHPRLTVNPVFNLRPGTPILHPVLRQQLAPVLDRNFFIRPDAPIEFSPEPDPRIFQAPANRLEAMSYPAKRQ